MMLLLFVSLISYVILADASTIFTQVGSNVTFQSYFSPYPDEIPYITWYKQVSYDSSFYEANKLCEAGNTTHTYPHPFLKFDCVNKSLNLYNLQLQDSGLYHATVLVNDIEQHNDIVQLHVIDLSAPQCDVSSYYTNQTQLEFCLILINCSKVAHRTTIYFNGKYSSTSFITEYGGTHLPNFYNVTVEFFTATDKLQKTHNIPYDFNDLCQIIVSPESLNSFNDFIPILIAAVIATIFTISVSLGFYCLYKPKKVKFEQLKLKQRPKIETV
ncbi:E3 CR1-beta CD5 [Simian mastadenovirus C]|uniref:E3 CR1-beta CD5 n=1 Tax=Simian mastadenovirus C TaxID=1962300 RepID=M9Z2P6_9ADEN|nr:E3 CR1-beta CD5 [Simian mastadenovirus C]